jgi:hypothetical protein
LDTARQEKKRPWTTPDTARRKKIKNMGPGHRQWTRPGGKKKCYGRYFCQKTRSDEKLWTKYAELRAESLRSRGDISLATQFYGSNRLAMDLGSRIAWPERYNHDELSAIESGAYSSLAKLQFDMSTLNVPIV